MTYTTISIISAFGIAAGICEILKYSRGKGIIQVLSALACPVMAVWFCALKESRAFGGTDWEFMLWSVTADHDAYPWMLLAVFAAEILLAAETILKMIRRKTAR